MFVWWGVQTYKLLQNSATLRGYILVSLQQIMFKLGIFTNFFKSFSAALTDFCWKGLFKLNNVTYLFSRVGRTTSGFINARFWRAPAASKLPLLLNTANITAGLRHSTNAVNSSSVSLDSSGIAVSQEFFGNLSLAKRK